LPAGAAANQEAAKQLGLILEIKAGPFEGKKISLATGQTVTFGRSATRSEFALPHDTFMSGLHFAVECGAQGCRVVDRKSSNGTFLNGAKIQDAMLANGDEIKGGQTIFTVKMVADAKLASFSPASVAAPPAELASPPPPVPNAPVAARPKARPPVAEPPPEQRADSAPPRPEEPPRLRAIPKLSVAPPNPAVVTPNPGVAAPNPGVAAANPGVAAPRPPAAQRPVERPAERGVPRSAGGSQEAAFSVMGWSFPAAPPEWLVQEGFGLQQTGHEEFPSSVAATEETLGGITLPQFVESQISMLRGYLRDARIEPTMPPRVGGADESMAVDVRHSTKDGRQLVYRRIYARSGSSVGVLTVTTLADEFSQVLQSLQPLLDGAAFYSSVSN